MLADYCETEDPLFSRSAENEKVRTARMMSLFPPVYSTDSKFLQSTSVHSTTVGSGRTSDIDISADPDHAVVELLI